MKTLLPIFTRSANSFEGEEHDEKVALLVRRHPFFVCVKIIFFVILAWIPLVFYEFFFKTIQTLDLLDIFFSFCSVWYLFIWSGIFYFLTMYTLDVWIITDHRIIDSTQNGFFSRTVSELHISRIQDISVETKGVIQTFLKFGDLQVQTAGAEEKFMFSQIPHPERMKDKIMELVSTHHSLTHP